MPTIDYGLRDIPAEFWKHDHWTVLTFLLLHANIRSRCWPGMRYIAGHIHKSLTYVQDTRDWLIEHSAVRLVSFSERVAEERKLPARQYVYELSGRVVIAESTYPYLYLPWNSGEPSKDPPDGSLMIYPMDHKDIVDTKDIGIDKSIPVRGKNAPIKIALAKFFFQGVLGENQALTWIIEGRLHKPRITGLLDRERVRQRKSRAELDREELARLIGQFRDYLEGIGIKELRSPDKWLTRWDGWRNETFHANQPPRLTYDPNCPFCKDTPGMVLVNGRADQCSCRKRILAEMGVKP